MAAGQGTRNRASLLRAASPSRRPAWPCSISRPPFGFTAAPSGARN